MILGIIGGLSPEATSEFYLQLIEKSRKCGNSYPHIIIDSVPLDFVIEDEMIIRAENQQRMLPFLIKSVKRLQTTDLIVIPCNTAHMFIEELRANSRIPIINIVEEVVKEIKHNGCSKVGLLATSAAIKAGIYCDNEIEFLVPSETEQKQLSEIIVKTIRNRITESDKLELRRIANNLLQECDSILLACTDLHFLEGDYFDSFDILVNSVFEKMGGEKNEKII